MQAWQHYGSRFAEEGLHPGMSDRAWQGREAAAIKLPSPATPAAWRTIAATLRN
jgi:hypothetical protein